MAPDNRTRSLRAGVRFFLLTLPLFALFASCSGREDGRPRDEHGNAAGRDSIRELTNESFAGRIASGGYHFVEFGGKRCIPCRQMQPILRDLARNHAPLRVSIVYMENSPELLEEWRIQLVPTQVVIGPGGKEITRHVGFWAYGDILAELKKRGIVS